MKAASDTNQEQVDKLFSRIDDWMEMEVEDAAPSRSPVSDGYWCPTHERSCFRACPDRKNGSHGAAGVLFFHRESGTFLLNLRCAGINHGGTWSTPGGALHPGENAFEGAIRETEEEIGEITVGFWQIAEELSIYKGTDTDWTYSTIVVEVEAQWQTDTSDWETQDNAWVTLQDMSTMRLHPGFKASVTGIAREMYYQGAFTS